MDARTQRRLRREVFKAKKEQEEKELALNNLLTEVADVVMCDGGYGWKMELYWENLSEAERKQYTIGTTKQLLKNGGGLPEKVKKYYNY